MIPKLKLICQLDKNRFLIDYKIKLGLLLGWAVSYNLSYELKGIPLPWPIHRIQTLN